MTDDKRQERELKRQIKKAGQRKMRRFLKDLDATPEDFDYGRKRSDIMNRPRPPRPMDQTESPPSAAYDLSATPPQPRAADDHSAEEHSTETP